MLKTQRNKHGWVIEMKVGNWNYPGFYQKSSRPGFAGPIETAHVYFARVTARTIRYSDEIVRKVKLNRNGNAVKVIPER